MELLSGSSANSSTNHTNNNNNLNVPKFIYALAIPTTTCTPSSIIINDAPKPPPPSRYESQKRRDWNTFNQYLRNHRPPVPLSVCCGSNVLEFLKYLDQFGKTKVHIRTCPFFGLPNPPSPCPCPLRQAWGSLDALIGRLRAAYEEHGGKPDTNPFGARGVRVYLREVRDYQAKARGISYDKKRKRSRRKEEKLQLMSSPLPTTAAAAATIGVASFARHHLQQYEDLK